MRNQPTTARRRRNTFSRMDGSTFNCTVCGRATRHTGVQSVGSKLCPQCYDLAGIENEISDGHCEAHERRDLVAQLVAHITGKGGNPAEWSALIALTAASADAPAPVETSLSTPAEDAFAHERAEARAESAPGMTTFDALAVGAKFIKPGQTTVYIKWDATAARKASGGRAPFAVRPYLRVVDVDAFAHERAAVRNTAEVAAIATERAALLAFATRIAEFTDAPSPEDRDLLQELIDEARRITGVGPKGGAR